ncbi:MAG: hypothetical protein Q7S33_00710 [Nanoarchaeota archaeon]|nr:hypothetical protein [Nanoarchaeota archaeon]
MADYNKGYENVCNEDKRALRAGCSNYNNPDCSHDCVYAKTILSTQNFMQKLGEQMRSTNGIQDKL